MIVAEYVPSVAQGSVIGGRPNSRRATVHLVKEHKGRPELEGRRVRTLCGRGGTVARVLAERPARGVCPDCRAIEPMGGGTNGS